MAVFKYIELFAGIGGFRSALDPLGGECVFASEIDPFATRAYKALYNGAAELHGDITKIDAQDIPDHDVLVGGFPCQAFSIAGQRRGFEEARGTLFFEIARIASAKQPRLILLENVKGLLSHDSGNTFETMCAVLNDIGYAIDFNVLNSKFFAVPQNRERIFIVASRDAEHVDWDVKGNGVVAKAKRKAQAIGVRTFNFEWPEQDGVTTRLRDILEANVAEKYYLSDDKTSRLIAQLTERGESVDSDDCEMIGHVDGINGHDICRRVYTPTGVALTIPTGSSGNTTPKIAVIGHLLSDSGQTGAVYGTDGIAPTLLKQHGNAVTKVAELQQYSDGSGVASTVYANYAKGTSPGDIGKGRRTHVVEEFTVIQKTHSACTTVKHDETGTLQAARLDKVPQVVVVDKPDWIPGPDDINRTIRTSGKSSLDYKHNCDYIAEEVGCSLRTRSYCGQPQQLEIRDEPVSNTLTSVTKDAMVLTVRPRYRIRKLTPRECWRLQGFTDAQHDTVAAAGISDSQRYKQAGNAVTVNVISAIGKRLIPLLNVN